MKKAVIMPKIGLDMEEGLISSWKKNVGDKVKVDDVLLEIETDKVTTEVKSTLNGILVEILAENGETIEITNTIAWIEEEE